MAGALLEGKCPRCREGDMFPYSVTHPTKFMKMNAECPHCKVRLQPEPGFYQGAMYVQYAFIVPIFVIVWLLLSWFPFEVSEWVYVGVSIAAVVLLVPLNYRYSRIVYLYAFGGIKYNPELSK